MSNHRVVSDKDGVGHKQKYYTSYEFITFSSENTFDSVYSRILLFGNVVFIEHVSFLHFTGGESSFTSKTLECPT